MGFSRKITILCLAALTLAFTACSPKKQAAAPEADSPKSLAVFVPGVLAGSPTYEMMDRGVRKAASEMGASVRTVEGGFNQAEWKSQVFALAAEKKYDLIISSNPSMPEICREIAVSYPEQAFLILEGSGQGDDTVATFEFSHLELSYLLGYFAGLVTASDELPGANRELKIGLIAGQEYPEMMQKIKPGFSQGLKEAAPEGELDFRVIGNWYDAAKASDLAKSMFSDGVDVILTIAGGANQGVLSAAAEEGKYVLWYDTSGYELEPGTVLGSGMIREDMAAYELTLQALKGELPRGFARYAGVKEGYVEFLNEAPLYLEHVPETLRTAMNGELEKLKSGSLMLR